MIDEACGQFGLCEVIMTPGQVGVLAQTRYNVYSSSLTRLWLCSFHQDDCLSRQLGRIPLDFVSWKKKIAKPLQQTMSNALSDR